MNWNIFVLIENELRKKFSAELKIIEKIKQLEIISIFQLSTDAFPGPVVKQAENLCLNSFLTFYIRDDQALKRSR